jgi:hypothetical protein
VILSRQARERAAQFAGARAAWSALMGARAEANARRLQRSLHRRKNPMRSEQPTNRKVSSPAQVSQRITRISSIPTCAQPSGGDPRSQAIRLSQLHSLSTSTLCRKTWRLLRHQLRVLFLSRGFIRFRILTTFPLSSNETSSISAFMR